MANSQISVAGAKGLAALKEEAIKAKGRAYCKHSRLFSLRLCHSDSRGYRFELFCYPFACEVIHAVKMSSPSRANAMCYEALGGANGPHALDG